MRKILFRGIPLGEREFIFGNYIFKHDYHFIQAEVIMPISRTPRLKEFQVLPHTVGQFTGMVDIYKRRIFEGDIITFDDSDIGVRGGWVKGEVIWNSDPSICWIGWHLWVQESPRGSTGGLMPCTWLGKMEIVDNKYEYGYEEE